MKGYIFKADVTLHIGQWHSILCIFDIRLHIHNFTEAHETAITILKLLGEIHKRIDWFCKHANIKQKGNQIAYIHHLLRNKYTAYNDNIDLNQGCKQTNPRLECAHIMVTIFLCSKKTIISHLEFIVFH